LSSQIAPATGLDSETTSRFLKGTFKARTSNSKIFSQFSVFRPRIAESHAPKSGACYIHAEPSGRPYRCALQSLTACRALLDRTADGDCPHMSRGSSPNAPLPRIFPNVEIPWKFCGLHALTGSRAATYVYKVSRTAGFALVASPSRTEGAPLRRKAIRSLTTRLNVPVVRERIRALV